MNVKRLRVIVEHDHVGWPFGSSDCSQFSTWHHWSTLCIFICKVLSFFFFLIEKGNIYCIRKKSTE